MGVVIHDIEYYLPEQVVDNDVLKRENPTWDMDLLMKRVGVQKRHIARAGETALDLAVKACERLLARHPNLINEVDGIIFCTQSEDYIMPPNSYILHKMCGFKENAFAFDFNLACSGFIYGLFLAKALISSGSAKNILLINADTYSKYINAQDRSARALFGDGASVTWFTEASAKDGIVDLMVATTGAQYDAFIIPAGGCRTPKSAQTNIPTIDKSGSTRTLENIHMDGSKILSFVNSKVPEQVRALMERNAMGIGDIDVFIFHQASRVVLDYLKSALQIPSIKFYENLFDVGNTVSASIPIALKYAMKEGKVIRGNKVLVSGFGVGLSWGTAIIEIG